MQPIYAYDDYRIYLRDAFEVRKQKEADFSYRRFSEAAGVRNPGYLLDIIKGKRNITPRILEGVIRIFEIPPKEAYFLKLLIQFGRTKPGPERERVYQEVLSRRHHSHFVRLNPAQSRYYEDTVYALILGAVQVHDFRGNYDLFTEFLEPPIAPGRLKKAVRELCEWGLLRQESNGRYVTEHQYIEPPSSMGNLVRRINQQFMHEGADHASRMPLAERHISTLMLSVTRKTRNIIEEKIEGLRREILDLARDDGEAEEVIQLGLLLLPRTKRLKRQIDEKARDD